MPTGSRKKRRLSRYACAQLFSSGIAFPLLMVLSRATAAGITVTGANGNSLTLTAPATRIVSLAPDLTELAYDAGAGPDMAGADRYSTFPAAAKKLPRVGDAFAFDLERILALKPDLILAWQGGTPVNLIERLRAFHLPVLVIGTHRVKDIAHNLELIGKVSGHEAKARTAAKSFLADLRALRARYAGRRPVRVFYEISQTPLYTVGGGQVISSMITLCGGRNIFSELKVPAAPVSLGAVLARDPQAIVTGADRGAEVRLQAWHRWPQMRAVETKSLFRIRGGLLARATPRMLQGGRELCQDLAETRKRDRAE